MEKESVAPPPLWLLVVLEMVIALLMTRILPLSPRPMWTGVVATHLSEATATCPAR